MNAKKFLALVLAFSMLLTVFPMQGLMAEELSGGAPEAEGSQPEETAAAAAPEAASGLLSYAAYLAAHPAEETQENASGILAAGALAAQGPDAALQADGALLMGEGNAFADYIFQVAEPGLYRVGVSYAQTVNTNKQITIGLLIDDAYPFKEADEILLPRIFADRGEIRQDATGNEIAPKQVQVFDRFVNILQNTNGMYENEYVFYLDAGTHRLTVAGGEVEFLLYGMDLYAVPALPAYQDYLAETKAAGARDTSGHLVKVQAEKAYQKSDSVLYPSYDRVNVATEDQHGEQNNPKYIRINTIGGSLWKTTGQWITWQIDVPEDGYYNLGMKFRQNYMDGLFTSRDIYVDGEMLFEEMKGVKFVYDDVWQTMNITDESGEAVKIYLTAGMHEIRMEVTTGDFAETLRSLSDCIYEINDLYRRIIMITSTKPDSYTDYFLTDRIPDMLEIMERNRQLLAGQVETISEIAGGRGSKTTTLDTLAVQLALFLEEPEEITDRLSSFKDNISAVGSWLVTIQDQALQLDYLYLKSPDVKTPSPEGGFGSGTWYSVRRFFASFDSDASAIASENEGLAGATVKVWLSTGAGRDQAQVLKDLIDESFTPETGINVELELVQGSLIEATLAGMGPDVALMVAEDQPANFAIRGALYDISQFEDFEEVTERFYDAAITPFWFEGGCYALPDTQVFNMLFYRTDVFEDLGLTAPETWEEFYALLSVIQRNNLQVTVQDIFPTIYFQNGGSYYNETGTRCLLDSQAAIDAMTTYTNLYTTYGFEVKTDFYSRFRSGELVMSIQPYNMYNQLMVAAPEINGLWAMVPVPGTVQEDGSISRAQNTTVTGTIMLSSAKNKDAAWEFMKWWSRDDVKAQYGIALEGLMGASARFTPANIGTLPMLPWSNAEVAELEEAMRICVGIPQLPGSYYTARGLMNAFRSIVYNEEFPRSVMKLQTRYINEEITRKRVEFGLITYEEESQDAR